MKGRFLSTLRNFQSICEEKQPQNKVKKAVFFLAIKRIILFQIFDFPRLVTIIQTDLIHAPGVVKSMTSQPRTIIFGI